MSPHDAPDSFDAWLTGALQARPLPAPRADLVAAVLERVRVAEERQAHLALLARRVRLSCLAAAVMVVALLLAGFWYMGAGSLSSGQTGDAGNATSNSVTSGVTSSSTSGEESSDGAALGLVILGAAVVGVAGRMVLRAEREPGIAVG